MRITRPISLIILGLMMVLGSSVFAQESRIPDTFEQFAPAANTIIYTPQNGYFKWTKPLESTHFTVTVTRVFFGQISSTQINTAEACGDSVCKLPYDFSALEDGDYVWSVTAFNVESQTDASNGPLGFTIDRGGLYTGLELLTNGTFEAKNGGEWVRVDPKTARIKCNKDTLIVTPFGECAAMLRTGGVLKQRVNLGALGLELNTEHELRLEVEAAPVGTGLVRVIAIRFDGTRQKFSEDITPAPALRVEGNEYYTFYTDTNMTSPVKKLIIQLRSTSGKVFYDNVSLKRGHYSERVPLPPAAN